MISNLEDLKTWSYALATGKLLSKSMHAEQIKAAPPNTPNYGLGIMIAGKGLGHSGEVPGYNSSMYYFPSQSAWSQRRRRKWRRRPTSPRAAIWSAFPMN